MPRLPVLSMWASFRPEAAVLAQRLQIGPVDQGTGFLPLPADSLSPDAISPVPPPPLHLKEPEGFAPPPLFWQRDLDSLFTAHTVLPSDSLTAKIPEKLDQQLLQPDYQVHSIPLPQQRPVSQNTPLAWALLGVLFLAGLIRWLEPEKLAAFFRAYFSARPVSLLMRDRFVFPPPGFLFFTASLVLVLGFSWLPFIENALWSRLPGLLLWLLGGFLIYAYWLLKHTVIRLWGLLMDDKEMPSCHILFSSQGLVLGGLVGLFSGLLIVSGRVDAWQRSYWLAAVLTVAPAWTLVRTLVGVPFRQPVRFLYNLYYLCTLEILPLLGLWNRVPDFPSFWPAL